MRARLFVASLWTLGLLFGMLSAIILLVLYYLHSFSPALLVGSTILFNLIIWLISPSITDWIQRVFYKAVYYKQAEFIAKYPKYGAFIAEECQKTKTPFPKIGFISDDNPTAYSYGSGKWNSRIVFTKGLLTYLEEDEVKAVLAHELGHVVHRDFIVMSIANAIIQLLYEISDMLTRTKSNNSRNNAAGALIMVGYLAYVFYWIGSFIVLFLNRLREYYADEFSAETMQQSEPLENALVKIAYGIMAKEDTDAGAKLLKSTQTMGIMSLASAKNSALAIKVSNMEPAKVAQVMLFDIVSPWAWLAQLTATHPLTGRRLLRLEKIAGSMGKKPRYDLEAAKVSSQYNKRKVWLQFWAGSLMYFLPVFTVLALLASVPIILINKPTVDTLEPLLLSLFPILLILYSWRVFYMFPSVKNVKAGTIFEIMTDLYASPIRGRPIVLEGEVVGRGIPGYMFGEDMMLQDKTGLLYIDYQGAIPLVSRLIVALKKLKNLIGKNVTATGWFYRSNTQFMRLKVLNGPDGKLRSYQRLYNILGAFVLAAIVSLIPLGVAAATDQNIDVLGDNNKIAEKLNADYKPKTFSNECYQMTLPTIAELSKVSTTGSSVCQSYIAYPVKSSDVRAEFNFNIEADPMAKSFQNSLQTWRSQNVIKLMSEVATTVDGLPAEKIVYTPNIVNVSWPNITYLIDTNGLITKGDQHYFTEVTTTYSKYNEVQFEKVIATLKVKKVDLH